MSPAERTATIRKSKFTDVQIAYAIRQVEQGTAAEPCRKLCISEQTFYTWKKRYAGMGLTELKRVKQLKEENRRLKSLARSARTSEPEGAARANRPPALPTAKC